MISRSVDYKRVNKHKEPGCILVSKIYVYFLRYHLLLMNSENVTFLFKQLLNIKDVATCLQIYNYRIYEISRLNLKVLHVR